MFSLSQSKKFVLLHAKTLGIGKEVKKMIDSVESLNDSSEKGWGPLFINEAKKQKKLGNIDKALGFYNIARFPFPNTKIQQEAYKDYLDLFNKNYIINNQLKKISLSNNKAIIYYKEGISNKEKQILIICGGIISLKEQWIRALNLLNKFGFSIVLTELPGVGQNNTYYDNSSCTFFTKILNELNIQGDANCHILGISFSGYIALQNSNTDHRIKSITMVGTPINSIYHDKIYFDNLPEITKKTIIYNINKQLDKKPIYSNEELFHFLDENFPLPVNKNNNIKIFYLQSKYDEVIPHNEISYLRQNYYHFKLLTLPDVHGSPNYHKTVVLFVIWSVLKSMNKTPITRTFIKLLINISKVIRF